MHKSMISFPCTCSSHLIHFLNFHCKHWSIRFNRFDDMRHVTFSWIIWSSASADMDANQHQEQEKGKHSRPHDLPAPCDLSRVTMWWSLMPAFLSSQESDWIGMVNATVAAFLWEENAFPGKHLGQRQRWIFPDSVSIMSDKIMRWHVIQIDHQFMTQRRKRSAGVRLLFLCDCTQCRPFTKIPVLSVSSSENLVLVTRESFVLPSEWYSFSSRTTVCVFTHSIWVEWQILFLFLTVMRQAEHISL